jgi:hypothetical protein
MPVSADAFDGWIRAMIGQLLPGKVCDIGPGAGKYGKMVRGVARKRGFAPHLTAVEIDPAYVDQFGLSRIYDKIIIDDAVNLITTPRIRFDLVIIGDCIEHMRKSNAIDLLNFLVYRSGYICVVFPEQAIQDDVDGHAAEAHISVWSEHDFKSWNVVHEVANHPRCTLHLFLIRGYQPVRRVILDGTIVPEHYADSEEPDSAELPLWTERLAAAEAAVAEQGDDPRRYDRFGYMLLEAGQVDRAINTFLQGLERAPQDAELFFKLSHAYCRAQRPSDALVAAQHAVEADPGRFHPQMHLGSLLRGGGLLRRAEQAFRSAEKLQADDPRAPAALAEVLASLGRFGEAVAAAQRALDLAPDDDQHMKRHEELRSRLLTDGGTVSKVPI